MPTLSQREVQVRPLRGQDRAQIVDLLVQAVPLGPNARSDEPFSVVVEVKCAWNKGVFKDMERQLLVRYLRKNQYNFGIYVVAYFTCAGWNRKKDDRKLRGASRGTIEQLRACLDEQASRLSTPGIYIESFVLDARIDGV